jgi:ubiquinone/menaquinone biosynthesis C-methylase UbiE
MTTPAPPEDPQELFRRLARNYDQAIRRYQPTYDAMLGLSTDLARVAAPGSGRCLDFGTGTGAAIPLLAALFDEIVALDPGKPMLELARARVSSAALGTTGARVSFIEGTAQTEDANALSNESFDAVHCSLVLMFVKGDSEKSKVLEFFHRLLRPAGVVVITDIVAAVAARAERDTFGRWKALMRQRGADDEFVAAADRQVQGMMHRRTVDQLAHLLEQAGFANVEQPFQALHTVMLLATK